MRLQQKTTTIQSIPKGQNLCPTFFLQSSSSAWRDACSDGQGQLHYMAGIHKHWMTQWFGTHASSRTPSHHGHPHEREKQGICQDWTKESDG